MKEEFDLKKKCKVGLLKKNCKYRWPCKECSEYQHEKRI